MTSTTNKVTRIRNTIKNFNKHGLASDIDVPKSRRTQDQKAKILAESRPSSSQAQPNEVDFLDEDDEDFIPPAKLKKSNPQSTLVSYAIKYPNKVEIFRRNFHRGSGKPLFVKYDFNIIEQSNYTLTFCNAAIIRKSDIVIKKKILTSDLDLGDSPASGTRRQASGSGSGKRAPLIDKETRERHFVSPNAIPSQSLRPKSPL